MIKVGIVGAGGMGTVHYSNYKYIEDCKVVAIVGTSSQDKSRAEQWGLPMYNDIKSMVENEEIDVIDICTPTFLHKEHVIQSIEERKSTIVEKPIALNYDDAKEMFDYAEEKGVLLFVAQVLQFTKEVEILRNVVESGEYGKALDGYFERLSACPKWAQGGWLFDKDKSGLIPFDLHIHDLDVIISIFGKPKNISYTSCGGRDKDYKEQYRINYEYDNLNVVGEAAWFNADIPFTARYRVYFENGMIINDGSKVTAYKFGAEKKVFDTEDAIKVPTGINVPPTGWYLNELKHFINCIKENKKSEVVSKEQVLTVIKILESFK
ncbi:Gfo/Idh/MocA family oxidoreductase [Clostridium sp. NSJ-145]|uniref:Gfo/Idh/MocA family protein n=1 Tax=Clostridium sp. NSJ-145 TaxID=2897777 RepID=UPI001E4C68D6|nr:Gfo/Idh/MocA family oxidoreductase [Clostridium sp. NSJ-145]